MRFVIGIVLCAACIVLLFTLFAVMVGITIDSHSY